MFGFGQWVLDRKAKDRVIGAGLKKSRPFQVSSSAELAATRSRYDISSIMYHVYESVASFDEWSRFKSLRIDQVTPISLQPRLGEVCESCETILVRR